MHAAASDAPGVDPVACLVPGMAMAGGRLQVYSVPKNIRPRVAVYGSPDANRRRLAGGAVSFADQAALQRIVDEQPTQVSARR